MELHAPASSTAWIPGAQAGGAWLGHLDDAVCQLGHGHAAREACSCVAVRDVGDQLEPELAGVEDALEHLPRAWMCCSWA